MTSLLSLLVFFFIRALFSSFTRFLGHNPELELPIIRVSPAKWHKQVGFPGFYLPNECD